jgi:hypothetical protein
MAAICSSLPLSRAEAAGKPPQSAERLADGRILASDDRKSMDITRLNMLWDAQWPRLR